MHGYKSFLFLINYKHNVCVINPWIGVDWVHILSIYNNCACLYLGYRPILDAMKSLVPAEAPDIEVYITDTLPSCV